MYHPHGLGSILSTKTEQTKYFKCSITIPTFIVAMNSTFIIFILIGPFPFKETKREFRQPRL